MLPFRSPDWTKLEPLVVPLEGDRPSGFRHVTYVMTDELGREIWHAKVKVNGRLVCVPGSRSYHPHVSAMAVADWYEERFGAWWDKYVHRTMQQPVRVWRSRSRGGWLACVWIVGQREEVRVIRRRQVTAELRVFASREEAKDGAQAYLDYRCGLFKDFLAFRVAEGR